MGRYAGDCHLVWKFIERIVLIQVPCIVRRLDIAIDASLYPRLVTFYADHEILVIRTNPGRAVYGERVERTCLKTVHLSSLRLRSVVGHGGLW